MSRWFRVYGELIDDPKFIRLGPDLRNALFTVWCIASTNDGCLPDLIDVAIKFRLSEARTKKLLDELERCFWLDRDEDGTLRPHNWDGRQYKSDVSTERVKRFRKRERNVSVTPPEAETEQIQSRTDIADAVDPPATPLVGEEARDLADELAVIAGHDLKFIPPGWCGAAMRVQTWLASGWSREVIVNACRGAMGRKRGPPPNSVQFFEKAIAEEIVRQSAPLPKIEVREAETITVTHGTSKPKSNSLIAAIDRRLAEIEAEAGPDPTLPESNILSLPDRSVR